jgi:hypothetical protein
MQSTQYVFVNSAKGQGRNDDFFIDIPEDSLRADVDSYLKLTLLQHTMVNTLTNVQSSHNEVTVNDDVPFSIPPGNYAISQYLGAFNASQGSVTAKFNQVTNRMTFETQSECTLRFQGNLAFLFGMRPDDNVLHLQPGETVSPYRIVPMPWTQLLVRLTGATVAPANIANVDSPMNTTDIVGIVPMRAAPWLTNVYVNHNDSFVMPVFDRDLQRIGFRVTDQYGQAIPDLGEWTAVIRCDVCKTIAEDPTVARLDQLVKYARFGFLKSYLKE